MRGMELEGLGAELGQMEVLCVDFPAVSMPKEGFFELLRKRQKNMYISNCCGNIEGISYFYFTFYWKMYFFLILAFIIQFFYLDNIRF
jgi:hypothetical protein